MIHFVRLKWNKKGENENKKIEENRVNGVILEKNIVNTNDTFLCYNNNKRKHDKTIFYLISIIYSILAIHSHPN